MFLSIDPGLNNLGLTVFSTEPKFHIHYTKNISNIRKLTPEEKEVEKKYDLRTVKVLSIQRQIEEILSQFNITHVIFEAPFFHALTPNAFGSLLEVIQAVKYNCFVPKDITVQLIEPTVIKSIFTKEGFANKNMMRLIFNNKIVEQEITIEDGIDLALLTEHQVDSIAIGYTYNHLQIKQQST